MRVHRTTLDADDESDKRMTHATMELREGVLEGEISQPNSARSSPVNVTDKAAVLHTGSRSQSSRNDGGSGVDFTSHPRCFSPSQFYLNDEAAAQLAAQSTTTRLPTVHEYEPTEVGEGVGTTGDADMSVDDPELATAAEEYYECEAQKGSCGVNDSGDGDHVGAEGESGVVRRKDSQGVSGGRSEGLSPQQMLISPSATPPPAPATPDETLQQSPHRHGVGGVHGRLLHPGIHDKYRRRDHTDTPSPSLLMMATTISQSPVNVPSTTIEDADRGAGGVPVSARAGAGSVSVVCADTMSHPSTPSGHSMKRQVEDNRSIMTPSPAKRARTPQPFFNVPSVQPPPTATTDDGGLCLPSIAKHLSSRRGKRLDPHAAALRIERAAAQFSKNIFSTTSASPSSVRLQSMSPDPPTSASPSPPMGVTGPPQHRNQRQPLPFNHNVTDAWTASPGTAAGASTRGGSRDQWNGPVMYDQPRFVPQRTSPPTPPHPHAPPPTHTMPPTHVHTMPPYKSRDGHNLPSTPPQVNPGHPRQPVSFKPVQQLLYSPVVDTSAHQQRGGLDNNARRYVGQQNISQSGHTMSGDPMNGVVRLPRPPSFHTQTAPPGTGALVRPTPVVTAAIGHHHPQHDQMT
eukprot:GFYU01030142.1.p1 GENE.GFYU01030142.1~~GFYU01030142.1.p1  ORF type:complete len:629 (+),score=111.72 GFYU01030142.1:225-2111(+)